MEKNSLKVDTKTKVEKNVDEILEPASPTSNYYFSEVATLYILCIFELEIPINSSLIFDFFNGPFVQSHPRLSCIPIEDKKGRKLWKKVEVNVEDHIKVPNFPEGLSIESYSKHIDDYMSKLTTSKMELEKPLWEVHCFNHPTKNATSTLFVKFHHAMGDGASLMGIVLTCFKRVDDPTLPLRFFPATSSTREKPKSSIKTSLIKSFNVVPNLISYVFCSLYDLGQNLKVSLVEDDCTPIRSGHITTNLPSSGRVCSVTLSLREVKRIKSVLKLTVNDVVVGIMAFAARLYIEETEQKPKPQKKTRMTASIPVNFRSSKSYTSPEEMRKAKTWGNRMSAIQVSVPNLDEDYLKNPLKYIIKIHKIMKRKRTKSTGALHLSVLILDAIKMCGGYKVATQTFEKNWRNSSFVITNVIGPIDQISIGNHPIKGFYFIPTNLNLSLMVSVMSYMEKIRIGLLVENGFIDHQRLVTCVEKVYQLILQALPPST